MIIKVAMKFKPLSDYLFMYLPAAKKSHVFILSDWLKFHLRDKFYREETELSFVNKLKCQGNKYTSN